MSPLSNSKGSKRAVWAWGHTYLDLILHSACKVLDDEGGLQDWCAQEVLVVLMLLLELGQQGVTCSMWEAADRGGHTQPRTHSERRVEREGLMPGSVDRGWMRREQNEC